MKNNQLLPFERNRYYKGKLLTSADFVAEQDYVNNKRRFLSEMLNGSGIICGFSVYNLDDISVMVESGAALDGRGREIVMEKSIVKKLSAIEGFEDLTGERAYLCIRYAEEDVNQVYAVNRESDKGEYEANRVCEGYQLFLTDIDNYQKEEEAETEFLSRSILYSDSDYGIEVIAPSRVSCGSDIRIRFLATKYSEEPKDLSLRCILHAPTLLAADGGHTMEIEMAGHDPGVDNTIFADFWMSAQDAAAEGVINIAAGTADVTVGGQDSRLADNFSMDLIIEDMRTEEIIETALGRVPLESLNILEKAESLPLAELKLQRAKNAYLIEEIREDGVKRYLATASGRKQRKVLEAWYSRPAVPVDMLAEQGGGGAALPDKFREPLYATGVCEIPLGRKAKREAIFYSDEVFHGLGPGSVTVEVGFEYIANDEKLKKAAANTIYGNPMLFDEEHPPVAAAETAVKVMNDRGSFIAAVMLLRDTDNVVLSLRWVAIKHPTESEAEESRRIAGRSISAVPSSVVLTAGESFYFPVEFQNMEKCDLVYELSDADSGVITEDGVYTAPGAEGVYEVRISCKDMPLINTYAYAVVKKQKTAADEELPEEEQKTEIKDAFKKEAGKIAGVDQVKPAE